MSIYYLNKLLERSYSKNPVGREGEQAGDGELLMLPSWLPFEDS
jgi:hypothetical protein